MLCLGAGGGESMATGRPRLVIRILSPLCTRFRSVDRCVFAANDPTDVIVRVLQSTSSSNQFNSYRHSRQEDYTALREASNRPPVFYFGTGSLNAAGATLPCGQDGYESVMRTSPWPTSSGTRTVSWKRQLQQRSLRTCLTFTGGPPGSLLGNSSSAVGWASLGMALSQ